MWPMARPLRITFAGALYHVTARGNERKPVHRDDHNQRRFLERLAGVVYTRRWRVHAFVLMRNGRPRLLSVGRCSACVTSPQPIMPHAQPLDYPYSILAVPIGAAAEVVKKCRSLVASQLRHHPFVLRVSGEPSRASEPVAEHS